MHFEVLELHGEFFWRLLDANGRELDCSARRYATRRQAMQAVRRLRDCAASAPILMRRSTP